MSKIKLGITGYTGKMGQAILSEASNFKEFVVSAGLVRGDTSGDIILTDTLDKLCKASDVVIDFSVPEVFHKLVAAAVEHKVPLVSGTTPLKAPEFKALERASQTIPVLYSQNMSIGITALSPLLRELYLKLGDMAEKVEIIETHHTHKKDAPSGTAMLLASKMLNVEISDLPSKKIAISSFRVGSVFGEHEVLFTLANETIKISHKALNRNIFATGALNAALWIHNKKPGMYSMQDTAN